MGPLAPLPDTLRFAGIRSLTVEGDVNEQVFLTQHELSKRWHLSPRTLEGWRLKGIGPTYIKIGSRVLYRRAEIEKVEEGGQVPPC
jgi:hypothetical protein